MKLTSYLVPAAAAAVTAAAIFASTSVAQQPAGQPRPHPAPTNLQVLPKNLTGQQVHEIMEQWEEQLGAKCSTCHAEDPKNVAPNGRPRLNYADDSKPEKATARIMYKMTDSINTDYIAKVPNSGDPVTCGTCHRGHLAPPKFDPDAAEGAPAAPKN